MRYLIVVLILFYPVSSHAFDRWTQQDTQLEIAWQFLHVLDTLTTLDIKSHKDIKETNVFMGGHPNDSVVLAYMGGWAILHPLLVKVAPEEKEVLGFEIHPRKMIQSISIGLSGGAAFHNLSIGLSVNF